MNRSDDREFEHEMQCDRCRRCDETTEPAQLSDGSIGQICAPCRQKEIEAAGQLRLPIGPADEEDGLLAHRALHYRQDRELTT